MALSDVQALFADLLRDGDAAIADAERDRAIAAAVERYSTDRPRNLVADATAAAAGHALPLPDGWDADWSELLGVEYPIGEVPPALLDGDAWRLYAAPSGQQVQLDAALAAGAAARLTFTAPHQLDADGDTIPARHREAVAALAAANALDQKAAARSGDTDSTIAADSVDHRSVADAYAARARALRNRYFEILGVKPGRLKPAGAIADLDLSSGAGGDLFFHRRSRR